MLVDIVPGVIEKTNLMGLPQGDGRVMLKRDVGMAGLAVGEPVLGPYYTSIELGLDTRGQGKALQRFGLLGLGYLVVPLVVRGQTEARFLRIEAGR